MPLSAGILMIGSLYWDDNRYRVNWRASRLRSDREHTVLVPIRYGRQSQSWGNTYTMVISRLCLRQSHGLGTGKVIPLKYPVETPEQLVQEAELLWAAEQKKSPSNNLLSANWGCVALMVNSDSQVSLDLLDGWRERVTQESQYGKLCHTKQEGLVVTVDGFLNVPWPRLLQEDIPLPMDILLATATNPTLTGDPPTYPRIREIARAWRLDSEGNDRYFWRNREGGIHTYQDDAILKFLVQRQ
jgi:hypothetical protein